MDLDKRIAELKYEIEGIKIKQRSLKIMVATMQRKYKLKTTRPRCSCGEANCVATKGQWR